MNISSKFIVREFRESDRGYITRTMLYGHFSLSSYAKKNNRDSFLHGHNKIINGLLNHAKTLVIGDPIDTDIIYAFIIYEQSVGDFDIVHYAHVRKDFRGIGLLKNLAEIIKTKDCLSLSHFNDTTSPARLKKYYNKVIVDSYMANIKERL